MKVINCILFTIVSTLHILPAFGAGCDATQSSNCQVFSQAGGMKCICNSYKLGSPVTFCSERGPTGNFELCSEGSDTKQKCAALCSSSGTVVCENGYCHSN